MNSIKKILGLLSIVVLFISCGSDDADKSLNDLQGEWTAISFTADIVSEVGSGTTMTRTQTLVTGSNFDYDLNLEEDVWTTSGSYDTEVVVEVTGISIPPTVSSLENVEGEGSYTTEDNIITIQGSMFEYDMSGMGMTSINNEDQTATYSINTNGELTFTQNESIVTTMNGTSIVTELKSNSVWVRK